MRGRSTRMRTAPRPGLPVLSADAGASELEHDALVKVEAAVLPVDCLALPTSVPELHGDGQKCMKIFHCKYRSTQAG